MPLVVHKDKLDLLYSRYARREFISPDPLEFVHLYDDRADREVVGFVASMLAYGRVAQILRSVRAVLDRLGERPARAVADLSARQLARCMDGFVHRFSTGGDVAAVLAAIGAAIRRHGSLNRAFLSHWRGEPTVAAALCGLVEELKRCAGGGRNYLLVSPADGSACKRLNLYLRWMVRGADVDLGVWRGVPPSALLVPLDTHMHGIGRRLGVLKRAAADLRAVEELTSAFRRIAPDDPVKYDFPLTRPGIRNDAAGRAFLEKLQPAVAS